MIITIQFNTETRRLDIYQDSKLVGGLCGKLAERRYQELKAIKRESDDLVVAAEKVFNSKTKINVNRKNNKNQARS